MTEARSDESGEIWKRFLRKHWRMMAVFAAGAAIAALGAVLVYLWFVGEAQLSGLVPATLGLWTMGNLVDFLLNLLFWELVIIGMPVLVAVAAIVLLWWRKLPYEEREEYRRGGIFFGKGSRRSDGGSALWFLVNIGFVIKVYVDGNWDAPFADWTFDYLVYSYVLVLAIIVVIVGIPMLIGGAWWLSRWIRSSP